MSDRPSILVIDDEPNNFDVIQALLGNEGYLFHYASSGQRALDRLDRFLPDAILLDVMMPDLDGIEVCRRIKASPKWQLIPVIVVTALTDKAELERCLSTGAEDFISKPVNRLELVARVGSMLRIKRSHDSLQLAIAKLELAAKANNDLMAAIGDEVRTPINAILNVAQLLATTELTPEQHLHVRSTLAHGEMLLTVVNNILEFSKVDVGKLESD